VLGNPQLCSHFWSGLVSAILALWHPRDKCIALIFGGNRNCSCSAELSSLLRWAGISDFGFGSGAAEVLLLMNLLKLFARSLKFTLATGWQLGNEATRKEKE